MDKELDKIYSPSEWSKRCGPKEVIQHFYEFSTSKSSELQKEIHIESNIRYGSGEKMLLDIYSSQPNITNSPILVFVHGGYWQEGSKDYYGFFKEFCKKGIRVMVPGYDLTPQVTLEDIMDEMKELLKFLQQYSTHHKVKNVWLCGHSAGAQLVVSMLHQSLSDPSNYISGIILISGIYSLEPLIKTTYNSTLRLSCEDAIKLSPMKWKLNETNNYLKNLKVIMAVGEDESPAFIKQSDDYAQFLKEQGAEVNYMIVSRCDHFNIITDMYYEDFMLTKEIINNIFLYNK